MELKNLSYEELLKLQQNVIVEIGRRNAFTKAKTGVLAKIHTPMSDNFKKQGIEDGSEIVKAERAIFKLCDLATKNYRVKTHKNGKKYIQVNGAGILADENEYQAMCDEIVAVFLKHLEKETNND